jgi:hypothetical protein
MPQGIATDRSKDKGENKEEEEQHNFFSLDLWACCTAGSGSVHKTLLHIIVAALDLIAYLSLSTPHPASQPVSRLLSFLWIFPFFFTTNIVPRMFEEQPNGPNPCFPVMLRSSEFLWETWKSIWT